MTYSHETLRLVIDQAKDADNTLVLYFSICEERITDMMRPCFNQPWCEWFMEVAAVHDQRTTRITKGRHERFEIQA